MFRLTFHVPDITQYDTTAIFNNMGDAIELAAELTSSILPHDAQFILEIKYEKENTND